MKKTYKNPTLTVVNIQPAQMIAVSGKLDRSQTITNSNSFGARKGSFSGWDGDAEE